MRTIAVVAGFAFACLAIWWGYVRAQAQKVSANLRANQQKSDYSMEGLSNIVRLLEQDSLDLPKHYSVDDYEKNLFKWFSAFSEQIHSLTPENSISEQIITATAEIDTVCDALRETVSIYLQGDIHRSYAKFQEALGLLTPWLRKIIHPMSEFAPEDVLCEQYPAVEYRGDLYRVRPMGPEALATLELGGIFHMPFNLRHKVGSRGTVFQDCHVSISADRSGFAGKSLEGRIFIIFKHPDSSQRLTPRSWTSHGDRE